MKKLLISAVLLSIVSLTALGQNPLSQNPLGQAVQTPGIGSVLSSLGNGLNPTSLLSSFKLPGWLGSVSKLSPTDAVGAASLLGKLGGGLKPSSLTEGFSLTDWSSSVKSATTMASVATQAQSLVKNIKPDAFKSGFDVGSVTSALALLQQ